ncbi:MAG: DNA repair protein RecN [Flavobacteriales bacterium]|nr:DNA repair protein RecN [Flavobacteriales bacterium]
MIKKLFVSNFALIDSLEICPAPSLSILTGETGAGKSIILGALSLVMGGRADLSALRKKDVKCVIEATVDVSAYHLESFFEENDIDFEPLTIIRREILPSGKSRAFVNDTPILLDTLNALSEKLIDIHSQHQTLMLSKQDYRTDVLDAYCGNGVLFTQYKEKLASFLGAKKTLEALKKKKDELNKNDEYNKYILRELEGAKLIDGEEEDAEELLERLSNTQNIKEALFSADELFNTEQTGIITSLHTVRSELSSISRYLPENANIDQRMDSIIIDLKDISDEVSSLLSNTENDPELLEKTSQRLDIIYTLKKKHAVDSVAELLEIQYRVEKEVNSLIDMDNDIAEAEKNLLTAQEELKKAGKNLSDARKKGGKSFSEKINGVIRTLGMPAAVFDVQVTQSDSFHESGMDDISFMFCANAGGKTAPVEKNASGGELSRIMLSLKCAMAEKTSLPTIVLDEIDTGVSGEIADRMGCIMEQMGKRMQVIVITHLPQIAARGDVHLKVFKKDVDGTTTSMITELSPDERVNEIAGMISGSNVSEAAMVHARELLKKE